MSIFVVECWFAVACVWLNMFDLLSSACIYVCVRNDRQQSVAASSVTKDKKMYPIITTKRNTATQTLFHLPQSDMMIRCPVDTNA